MSQNEFICPLCNAQNYCGINSAESCWCMNKEVPKALIEQVPADQKNKSCICARCVDKLNQLTKSAN